MRGFFSRALIAGAGIGAAGFSWGLAEARMFCVRRFELPVLPAGQAPLRVLHLSDVHLVARQRAKLRFLAGLASLEPDLVINTGDNFAEPKAMEPLFEAWAGLRGTPGVFVFGSNDYYRPKFRNPAAYLLRSTAHREEHSPPRDLPWRDLRDRMQSWGWQDLTHRRVKLAVAGRTIAFRGTDDAHLGLDDYALVAGPPDDADLNIGVTHAPYLRLLDAMAADRMDLIVAGHTHGGQVCVPFKGAIITNCDLEPARAKGLSTHTHGGHTALLHVSAGVGSSPFAPYRFACRPEVSLLTLLPVA
ncbi:MAG: metallophosphoesterase family protein [Propionibacteriaceae bacterium]|nr:metallophosphoesterase family protein [Propionibacteriaceae bacterium]